MGRRLLGVSAVVDLALEAWGRESRSRYDDGPGWSPDSILSRMITQGVTAAAQFGAPPPAISDKSLAVDAAVRHLSKAKTRKVVRLWYGSRDAGNQTICARLAGVSYRNFKLHLSLGRQEVADFLGICGD